MPDNSKPRRLLLDAFRAGLDAARGDRLVARVPASEWPEGSISLVAAGKAAMAMSEGAGSALGDRIHRGLVVAPQFPANDWPFPCRVIEGEHPVPGEGSLTAGEALLQYLDEAPKDDPFIFLISGGASSLAEMPVPGVSLEDLRRANEWLLGSGLDIRTVNAVRRSLSRIKGGRLARYLGERHTLMLALSDVPGNDPAVIGSGWLALSASDRLPADLPDWLADLAGRATPPPSADDPVWQCIRTRVIGDNATARDAAAGHLREGRLPVEVTEDYLDGDAAELGRSLARQLVEGPPGVRVWGGECTVRLPVAPGRGGRCQHLALAAAEVLAGHEDCYLLAAGTDGRDGNSDVAGALVDGGTVGRGEAEGLSAGDALARADSGTFLDASGDLVDTGPTGTNVNDLVIGMRLGARDRGRNALARDRSVACHGIRRSPISWCLGKRP